MQKPTRGAPVNARRHITSEQRILWETVARHTDGDSKEGSTDVGEVVSAILSSATVSIHVVSILSQSSNLRPIGQNNGSSDGPSAGQRQAGSWKSRNAWLVYIPARKKSFPD